jgi:hypothetical protein
MNRYEQIVLDRLLDRALQPDKITRRFRMVANRDLDMPELLRSIHESNTPHGTSWRYVEGRPSQCPVRVDTRNGALRGGLTAKGRRWWQAELKQVGV